MYNKKNLNISEIIGRYDVKYFLGKIRLDVFSERNNKKDLQSNLSLFCQIMNLKVRLLNVLFRNTGILPSWSTNWQRCIITMIQFLMAYERPS